MPGIANISMVQNVTCPFGLEPSPNMDFAEHPTVRRCGVPTFPGGPLMARRRNDTASRGRIPRPQRVVGTLASLCGPTETARTRSWTRRSLSLPSSTATGQPAAHPARGPHRRARADPPMRGECFGRAVHEVGDDPEQGAVAPGWHSESPGPSRPRSPRSRRDHSAGSPRATLPSGSTPACLRLQQNRGPLPALGSACGPPFLTSRLKTRRLSPACERASADARLGSK